MNRPSAESVRDRALELSRAKWLMPSQVDGRIDRATAYANEVKTWAAASGLSASQQALRKETYDAWQEQLLHLRHLRSLAGGDYATPPPALL